MKCGRPRNFDKQAALDAALKVFWRDGYQGASMTDLTAAMGINKPSLYATFGDKSQLYLQALQRYVEARIEPLLTMLNDPEDPHQAVRGFLRAMACVATAPDMPRGCLVVNSARELECSNLPPTVAEALEQASKTSLQLLESRFQRDQQANRLPAGREPQELARFFAAVTSGMAVMAKGGADRATLESVIDTALLVLDNNNAATRH